MKVIDILILVVVAAILALAVVYIVGSKKKGKKCIGCPEGACPSKGGAGCSCCEGCSTNIK